MVCCPATELLKNDERVGAQGNNHTLPQLMVLRMVWIRSRAVSAKFYLIQNYCDNEELWKN